jgi:serine/threonine protein kinase
MPSDERLSELLDTWQEAQVRGANLTPEDLCRQCPELRPEAERQIAVLRHFHLLAEPGPLPSLKSASEQVTVDDAPAPDVPPRPLLAAGRRFARYEILAEIGGGGMGIVYRARDTQLERDVALKVLRSDLAAHPISSERFLREARAMAAIRHDHVVEIYDYGDLDGLRYVTMPLLAGETLGARLDREKPLAPAEVARIGAELAAGLAAVHAKGLIHRDLKPSNVWLEAPGGRVKLLDFGLAREHAAGDPMTNPGSIAGTPGYMSPEQVNGLAVDVRADLFCLGTVLYAAAAGRPAFAKPTLTATLMAVAEENPPPARTVNPAVPAALSALIERLMAKMPQDRPASAQAVIEAIDAMEPGLPTGPDPADRASMTGPGPRPARQRRGVWFATAVAVVTLGAVGYALLDRTPRPDSPSATSDGKKDSTAALPAKLGAKEPVASPAPKLTVRVWKREDPSRGLELAAAQALPLRAGDLMRIEAETGRPAYLYVIYLDARGEASPLFPWRNNDWDDRPEEQPRRRLYLPEDPQKDAAPLEAGPSGIEAVLLLACDEPLDAAKREQLKRFFAKAPPQGKFDPLRGAVWLGPGERFGHTADRGRPALNQAGTLPDPVERIRRLVRGELKGLAGEVRGVCYPFQGD